MRFIGKLPHVLLSGVLLMSTGCFAVPSPYAEQLKPVSRLYGSVKAGTGRAAVEEKLGQPTQEANGVCTWESRFDELNYATIKVWFDGDETATKVEVTRAHGSKGPGFRATAISTRTK